MTTTHQHDVLVSDAENAINAVHGDSSVPQVVTIESLRQLEGQCAMLAQAVEDDLRRAETE